MSWKSRYNKSYKTSNPNLLITAVCSFPNIYDTIDKVNEYYDIAKIQNDEKYMEIVAYFELLHGGCSFIPVAFGDRVPKLNKLQSLTPVGKSYFWCIGYVSKYLIGGAKSVDKNARQIEFPSFEILLDWLKYHTQTYNGSTDSSVNSRLFNDTLRKYISENTPSEMVDGRLFNLIYNCKTIIDMNRDMNVSDWIAHLENLKNRNFYEIIVNDFK